MLANSLDNLKGRSMSAEMQKLKKEQSDTEETDQSQPTQEFPKKYWYVAIMVVQYLLDNRQDEENRDQHNRSKASAAKTVKNLKSDYLFDALVCILESLPKQPARNIYTCMELCCQLYRSQTMTVYKLEVMIPYLTRVSKTQEIRTAEGIVVRTSSYLTLKALMHSSDQFDSEKCIKYARKLAKYVSSYIICWYKPTAQQRQFIQTLLLDCFVLLSSIELCSAGLLIRCVHYSLIDMESAQSATLTNMLLENTVRLLSLPLQISYQNASITCYICGKTDIPGKYLSVRKQNRTTTFCVCHKCECHGDMGYLIPPILLNFHGTFQKEAMTTDKLFMAAYLCEDGINSTRFINSAREVDTKAISLSEDCLLFWQLHHEKYGLERQLKSLTALWLRYANNDNYMRRLRAVRDAAKFNSDVIVEALKYRIKDKVPNVRLYAVRAVIKICKSHMKLVWLVIDRLQDSDQRTRKACLHFLHDEWSSISKYLDDEAFTSLICQVAVLCHDKNVSVCDKAVETVRVVLAGKQNRIRQVLGSMALNKEIVRILATCGSENYFCKMSMEMLNEYHSHEGATLVCSILSELYPTIMKRYAGDMLYYVMKDISKIQYTHMLHSLYFVLDGPDRLPSRQMQQILALRLRMKEQILTEERALVEAASPLLAKVSVMVGKDAELRELVEKCHKIVELMSKNIESNSYRYHILRALLIMSLVSIEMHNLSVASSHIMLANSYECALGMLKILPQETLTILRLYWLHNYKFLNFCYRFLLDIVPRIKEEGSILIVYQCLEKQLKYAIKKNEVGSLSTIFNVFNESYERFVKAESIILRMTILRVMLLLLETGNMNPLEASRYLLSYMCDPAVEIRNLAGQSIYKIESRFLYCNFQNKMTTVLQYIVNRYGEVEVYSNGYHFFRRLIQINGKHEKLLSKRLAQQRITFLKKWGEIVGLEDTSRDLLLFFHKIIYACQELDRCDYEELLSSLNVKIQGSYHYVLRKMKKALKEENNEDEARQAARMQLRLLELMTRMTGGKSYRQKMAELEDIAHPNVKIPYWNPYWRIIDEEDEEECELEYLAQQLREYYDIINLKVTKGLVSMKKNTNISHKKTNNKSNMKSHNKSNLKSAPKVSISRTDLRDLEDERSNTVVRYDMMKTPVASSTKSDYNLRPKRRHSKSKISLHFPSLKLKCEKQ